MGTVTVAAATPASNATCWRHGAAPTSWPVFRSCRLLLELQATANRMLVIKSAPATMGYDPWPAKSSTRHKAVPVTARIPTPKKKQKEKPNKPAKKPQMADTKKPPAKTRGIES